MRLMKNEAGRYEVRIKGADGKYHNKSTGKTSRRDAERFVKESKIEELERVAELGIVTSDVINMILHGKKMSVEEAVEPWVQWMKDRHMSPMSIKNSEIWVRRWIDDMGLAAAPVSKITMKEIDGWVNDSAIPSKASTRRVMLSAIRSLLSYTSGMGMTIGNPASLVRVDMSLLSHQQKEVEKKPIFNDAEIAALLGCTAPGALRESVFWHAAIALGRWTGLRLSDIASLEWDCFRHPGRIAVWTLKRDKRIELPLDPPALQRAVSDVPLEDTKYLFPNERITVRDPDLRSTLSAQFAALLEHCGIVGKSFHCLRATYISACDAAGIPILHIARAVGHSNEATTRGYIRNGQD